MVTLHQPSPSEAQMTPVESRPGEQASSFDAVSIRGCAQAAAALRVPWLSLRGWNNDVYVLRDWCCVRMIQEILIKREKSEENFWFMWKAFDELNHWLKGKIIKYKSNFSTWADWSVRGPWGDNLLLGRYLPPTYSPLSNVYLSCCPQVPFKFSAVLLCWNDTYIVLVCDNVIKHNFIHPQNYQRM